jgi:hypothetical protein
MGPDTGITVLGPCLYFVPSTTCCATMFLVML